MLIITGMLIGSASTINSSTLAFLNPSTGNIIVSSTASITLIAILLTNEKFVKLKFRYTELRAWRNVTTLLYEKSWKQLRVDKKQMKKGF